MRQRVATTQAASRHAGEYRQRARELIDQAWDIPGADDRRHMLELAAIYERTADSLAPAPATNEAQATFKPPPNKYSITPVHPPCRGDQLRGLYGAVNNYFRYGR
jgi:hypothetical protein